MAATRDSRWGLRVVLVWQRQSIAATAAGHRLLRNRRDDRRAPDRLLETPGN